jgi:hypothetical protein
MDLVMRPRDTACGAVALPDIDHRLRALTPPRPQDAGSPALRQ